MDSPTLSGIIVAKLIFITLYICCRCALCASKSSKRNEDRAVPSPRVYPMGYPETRGTPRPNTGAPHPTTGVPNPVTGVPHPMTAVPHPMTGEPNPMAGVPHPMTGVPHPMTGVPHLMAGVPSITTGLPYSNTGPSSYSTESTHCADKPPSYEQAVKQSPYNADMLL